MSTVVKDLGAVSAYAYAVEKGYTGTEAEFAELMADYAEVGQRAEDAADSALESKNAAQTAATTATNKATAATTAATTATTKAGEASTSASTATSAKDTAVSASQTATTKATEATTAAATATSAATTATTAKDDAVSAKTAAQTAQTGAETAAASVAESAAQIATNAEDVSQLKSDKSDKDYNLYQSLGTVESGMISTSGSAFANASHIEISVNAGAVYDISGFAWNASFPLWRVLDSSDTIIASGGTDDSYHNHDRIRIPSGGTTLYVVGKTIASGMIPIIYSTYAPYIINSTKDTTDRTAEIQSALNAYKYVKLGEGNFTVTKLNMPQNSMLDGCGDGTVLNLRASETNNSIVFLNTDMTENSPSVVSIRNLKLDGGATARPATYMGRNGRVGIHHLARNTLLRLNNVSIIGFSSDGIHCEYVGLEEGYSIEMSNCLVKWCGCGINMDAKAEYANFTNTLVHFCYVGVNNYGGNNKYVNCGIENNVKGFQLDRSTDYADPNVSYLNNGHSSACGCSFNHNTYPVIGGGYYNGFAFVGCMFYAGTIIIANQVKGLMFANCMIGANTAIQIVKNYLVRFTNCIFSDVPTSVSLPTDHSLIKFHECYELENGTAVTY